MKKVKRNVVIPVEIDKENVKSLIDGYMLEYPFSDKITIQITMRKD